MPYPTLIKIHDANGNLEAEITTLIIGSEHHSPGWWRILRSNRPEAYLRVGKYIVVDDMPQHWIEQIRVAADFGRSA